MTQVYPILLLQAKAECELDQKLWLKSKDIYQTRKVDLFPIINMLKHIIKKFDIMREDDKYTFEIWTEQLNW